MKEENILEKVGGKTGFTVPPGYFDSVRTKIMDNLPEYKMPDAPKLTAWQRVKPYIYMAAMFAGIWCMMKMFHMISSSDLSLDNPPEAVAMAMANADHADYIILNSERSNSFLLEEELSDDYNSIEDFKEDFKKTDI